ncbi:ankyrin repeat-containing protein BDA1-like [Rhodamnia argentea]|uniref:Ankyrin repeat-containing protein BDA1-like n=1 Tax=Rhodamnia argentea TaxID=178133 RepID=A0ABM3HW23_9MYRT|nr:ankyrin repeat-containing protein BDA1-like [Rhodamnia argentea]
MGKSPAENEEEKARESRRRLAIAIERDEVNELYSLIEEDENLVDHGSEGPLPNTALHDAADKGKTKVAMEIAILKPSFARKLNRGGHSPMHLALQKKHYGTVRAPMTLDPELVRVRGRGGITPLHFVAKEKGDSAKENVELLELLAEFLWDKSSIEDLTNQCETAVHVALKSHNLEAFKVLFGWLKRVNLTEILDWKDQDGNTVLHIAVLERQPEIINLLIGHVKVNVRNFEGLTALEIFQANPSGDQDLAKKLRDPTLSKNIRLSVFLRSPLTPYERIVFEFGFRDESVRNIVLIVAALITTATYQAMLTPPGGYWQDNSPNLPANSSGIPAGKPHRAGNIILSGAYLYAFTTLNSFVFLASIGTICMMAFPLLPHASPVYLSAVSVGFAYFATLTIEFTRSDDVAGIVITACFFSLLLVSLAAKWKAWSNHNRLLCGIDATGRRVGHFPKLKHGK